MRIHPPDLGGRRRTSTLMRTTAVVAVLSASGCIAPTSTEDTADVVALGYQRVPGLTRDGLETEAAEAPPSWPADGRLDVETCLRVAIERDPGIRRGLEQVAIARATLAAEDRAPNPMIEFGIGVPIDGVSGAPAVAMLAQQITWLWTRGPRIDAAEARHRAAVLDAAADILDLDRRVRRRHAEALAADRLAAIATDAAAANTVLWRLSDSRAAQGEATRTRVDAALVVANESAIEVLAARASARSARIALLAVLGCPAGDPDAITVVASVDHDVPMPDDALVVETAMTARFDVAAATSRLEAAGADAELAGLRRIPEVSATLMWNRNFVGREALLPGARITLPIFDDGSPAQAAAAAAWRDAALTLLAARRDAIAEARIALESWRRAEALASGFEISVLEPARRIESLEASAGAVGSAEPDTLLDARVRRLRAERRTVEHRLAADVARIDLIRAIGGVLPDPPTTPEAPASTVISRRFDA